MVFWGELAEVKACDEPRDLRLTAVVRHRRGKEVKGRHTMARIAGVDVPNNKQARIGLTYIFGIGETRALRILGEGGHRSASQDQHAGRRRAEPDP